MAELSAALLTTVRLKFGIDRYFIMYNYGDCADAEHLAAFAHTATSNFDACSWRVIYPRRKHRNGGHGRGRMLAPPTPLKQFVEEKHENAASGA